MPRNVRNFWIELEVDGKRTKVATGPVKADGGFNLTIYQRDLGAVTHAMRVTGRLAYDKDGDGLLVLTASCPFAQEMTPLVVKTKR